MINLSNANLIIYPFFLLLSFIILKKKNKAELALKFSICLSVFHNTSLLYDFNLQPYILCMSLFILLFCLKTFKTPGLLNHSVYSIFSPMVFLAILSLLMLLVTPIYMNGSFVFQLPSYASGLVGDLRSTKSFIDFHNTFQSVFQTFKFVFLIIFSLCFSNYISVGKIKITRVYSFFLTGVVLVIVFAFYNCFLRLLGLSLLEDPLFSFVFNSSNVYDSYGIQSTFPEPSMFARYSSGCLFGFFNIINLKISNRENYIKEICFFIPLLLLTVFCQSSSGILSLLCLYIYVLLQSYRYHNFKLICFLILFMGIGVLLCMGNHYIYNYLDERIFHKMVTRSGIERSLWNKNALGLFKQSYFFGVGIGFFRASSFFYDLLSSFGLLGLFSFLFMFLKMFKKRLFLVKRDITIPYELRFFEGFLLGAGVVLLISNPNFTQPDLWISLSAVIGGYVSISRVNKGIIKSQNNILASWFMK